MKKVTLVIFILTIGQFVFSQTNIYHKFPTSNAIWRELEYDGLLSCLHFQNIITGDTIIGSFIYHKINFTGVREERIGGICNPNMIFSYLNGYAGAYREDTINKKVYLIKSSDSTEFLLYNFDLHQGDTIGTCSFCGDSTYNIVSSIDSILIGNDYRKRFWVSTVGQLSISNFTFLIEGIGSGYGFLIALAPANQWNNELLCFIQDGVTIFPDTGYICEFAAIKENELKTISSVRIYPNPFTTITDILFDKSYNDVALTVFDLQGKIIKKETNKNCSKVYLDRDDLENGFYFLSVTLDNKIIETKKIIISE